MRRLQSTDLLPATVFRAFEAHPEMFHYSNGLVDAAQVIANSLNDLGRNKYNEQLEDDSILRSIADQRTVTYDKVRLQLSGIQIEEMRSFIFKCIKTSIAINKLLRESGPNFEQERKEWIGKIAALIVQQIHQRVFGSNERIQQNLSNKGIEIEHEEIANGFIETLPPEVLQIIQE